MTPVLAVALLLGGSPRAASAPVPPAVSIHWEKSFDAALRKARKAGKPVIVDFWADWCSWCDRLNRTTYADPSVARKAQAFVAVKVNTEGSRKEIDASIKYEVTSLPTIVFLSPGGRQLWRVNGFQGPGQFPRTLDVALDAGRRVIGFEEALARDPDDPAALAQLGAHLSDVGTQLAQQQCLDEAHELLRKAVARDGERSFEDRRRSRMLLAILCGMEHEYAEAEALVKAALSLGPKNDDAPKLLFVLGRTQMSAGRRDESVLTFKTLVHEYPQSPLAQKARETLTNLEKR